jgi:hypothetical protein
MVTEELPLAHLGERQRSQWSRCQPDPSAIICEGLSQDARISRLGVVAVRCGTVLAAERER